MDRREFIKNSAVVASLPLAAASLSSIAATSTSTKKEAVKRNAGYLSWLEGNEPTKKSGATWGKSWAKGELQPKDSLALTVSSGDKVPLQSWPTAYWPDGSIKWTAHAVPAELSLGEQFSIAKGQNTTLSTPVTVKENVADYAVDTGVFSCVIPKNGAHIISTMSRNGRVIGKHARMVGQRQDCADDEGKDPTVESFQSITKKVTVEQTGPIRAVLKLEGMHKTPAGREWLPFSLRLYFYAGGDSLRISHSFIYDGDDQSDFIKGLGLRFDVVQTDETYNRHVRFVGQESGLWAESPQGLTGLRRDPGQAVREAQLAGLATPPLSEWSERVTKNLHYVPVWNDYSLSQLNAHGFSIKKRTKAGHAWIDSNQGQRASGVAYLGGSQGGILFGMRDFWQLHPVGIDIRGAGLDESEATLWFYSPDAPAMDVRFYHDGMEQDSYEKQRDALDITYEDYEPEFGSAVGVARTSDFTLYVLDKTPSRIETIELADTIRTSAQVVAAPEDYLRSGVFGSLWSLPDRSTKEKRDIEDRLDWAKNYYKQQIEQHHWYGFWNYGDIMHTYDQDRHVWRYDVGGYAWDNSELSPDLWLWYSFLRTGDADTFHIIENMTRHTRDVDIYHLGRFKGLGSRHNVQHWGCSAKQLRISTAANRRFHYYITGDERTGDVLHEVTDADIQLAKLNPWRKIPADVKRKVSGHWMSVGTDFGATAANWLTAWERTGEEQYRNLLEDAMRVIGGHPLGFFGRGFGYNEKTRQLKAAPDTVPAASHLSSVFGLFEICTELNELIDVPEFKAAWLRYGTLYNAGKKEQKAALGQALKTNLRVGHSRLTAYVAEQTGDKKLAKRAWKEFSASQSMTKGFKGKKLETHQITGPDVLNPIEEVTWISTNDAAQWGLAAIQNLALISDEL